MADCVVSGSWVLHSASASALPAPAEPLQKPDFKADLPHSMFRLAMARNSRQPPRDDCDCQLSRRRLAAVCRSGAAGGGAPSRLNGVRRASRSSSLAPTKLMSLSSSTAQARWFALISALLALGAAWMLFDAAARRAAQQKRGPQVQAVARLLGVADLALSSSSRWLRHPSVTEPGAAFADGPAIPDNDPAGALISPPLDVLAAGMEGRLGSAPARGRQ